MSRINIEYGEFLITWNKQLHEKKKIQNNTYL